MTAAAAGKINKTGPARQPGRTPPPLRKKTRSRVAALREAIETGRSWKEPLINLAIFLDQEVVPALTADGRPTPVDLMAHTDRLLRVQDSTEALLIAEHVEWLLHRPAQGAT